MRSLTKSGIRELSAKYRYILKKCAILNAMLLMFGVAEALGDTLDTIQGTSNNVYHIDKVTDDSPYTFKSQEYQSDTLVTNKYAVTLKPDKMKTNPKITWQTEAGEGTVPVAVQLNYYFKEEEALPPTTSYYYKTSHTSIIENREEAANKGDSNNPVLYHVPTKSDKLGGAIYNSLEKTHLDDNYTIFADFISNSTDVDGGAVYNTMKISQLTGDFISNSAVTSGGAIYNHNGEITTLIGNFIANTVANSSQDAGGGAIYNTGTIANLTGHFISNSVCFSSGPITSSDSRGSGGAIYNNNTITTLTGDFIDNYAQRYGGAIYNYTTIGELTGNFIVNHSDDEGGAIYNKNGNITNLTGHFIGNSAEYSGGAIYTANSKTIENVAINKMTGNFIANLANNGGAIYNADSIINEINGDFISNYATVRGGAIDNRNGKITNLIGHFIGNSAELRGGAIHNNGTFDILTGNFVGNNAVTEGGAIYNASMMNHITGDFISNYVSNEGGAIYNDESIINEITGNFTSNSAIGENSNGGAIYNSSRKFSQSTIGRITGSFISNYATNDGGAIYNSEFSTMHIVAQGDKNITFDGNYVLSGNGGAIYNAGTIGLYADENNSISFTGQSNVTGAKDVDGICNNGTLNLNGNKTDTYLGTITLQNVSGTGTTNIYDGFVNSENDITQGIITISDKATLTTNANVTTTNKISNSGTLNLNTATLDSNITGDGHNYVLANQSLKISNGKSISNLTFNDGATLNLITPNDTNISYETITIDKLAIETGKTINLTFDIGNTQNDKIVIGTSASGIINLTDIRIDGNLTQSSIDLFATDDNSKLSDLMINKTIIAFDDNRKYYSFTQDETNKGKIDILKSGDAERPWTIQEVISAQTYATFPSTTTLIQDVNTYQLTNDMNLTNNLGTLEKYNSTPRTFTITGGVGKGYTLNGQQEIAGITVNSGDTLNLDNITMKNLQNSTLNEQYTKGGAINNNGTIIKIHGAIIDGKTVAFDSNTVIGQSNNFPFGFVEGGAIYNSGAITNITGNFNSNVAFSRFDGLSYAEGGAVYNANLIEKISGYFSHNFTYSEPDSFDAGIYIDAFGGAVNNTGTINNIQGVFVDGKTVAFDSNYALAHPFRTGQRAYAFGGAIYNNGIVTITGGFKSNYAEINGEEGYACGGAIFNANRDPGSSILTVTTSEQSGDIEFRGNYVKGSYAAGGAIYNLNIATVNLNAKGKNDTITFVGDTTDLPDGAKDVDGIYNYGTLNINGDGNKATGLGVVSVQNIDMDINTDPEFIKRTNVFGGTLHVNKYIKQNTLALFNGSTLNLQNGKTDEEINVKKLLLSGNTKLMIDADLANSSIDQIKVTEDIEGSGQLNISDIRLLSVSDDSSITLSLFTDQISDNIIGNLSGIRYSPIFIYNADYNPKNGMITFTRTGETNPYVYAPSTMAQTTASMVGQVSGLAMDKLDESVSESEKGLSGGDIPKASNGWVKLMGFDDNVEFKKFDTMDSKTMTLAGGFNTDKVKFDNFDASFGIYAGYIGGRQKYTGNKIEQKGGYMGLSSELTKGNAFLLSTINGGFINNDVENMYGLDTFDTYWFGVGLKGGYNYALNDTLTLQPNVYAGYTRINTEDYTSASGVIVNTDNLNFFEVNPGFKLITQLDNEWFGFIQGKYAIVMDNGGNTKVNEFVLPNISTKDYFEYGVGMNKTLTDAWSLNGAINRRDGGRTGWNGSLEFKYHF